MRRGRLGQRGRRRRHYGAGRGVAEGLQGEGAAVEVGLPRVVRDVGCAQPAAPEVDGGIQGAEGLLLAGRDILVAPGQDHERRLALSEGGAAVAAGAEHTELDAARQFEPDVPLVRGDRHGFVPVALVAPRAGGGPVVEQRGTVHHDLDPAADAGRDPDQGADSAGVGRSPVVVRPARSARDRADGQEVLHRHPSRRGLPRRLQHHRPRQIPALLRDLGVRGAEPERPGGPVEQRPEHARGIRPRQAQPLDGAVWRNQAALLN
jgi:hypothetical protein